jgi:hypothetical protein
MAEMAMMQAPELIAELLQKTNDSQNGKDAEAEKASIALIARKNDCESGARRRMPLKCVYRKYARDRAGIFKHKKPFINTLLESYKVIEEIKNKLEVCLGRIRFLIIFAKRYLCTSCFSDCNSLIPGYGKIIALLLSTRSFSKHFLKVCNGWKESWYQYIRVIKWRKYFRARKRANSQFI